MFKSKDQLMIYF